MWASPRAPRSGCVNVERTVAWSTGVVWVVRDTLGSLPPSVRGASARPDPLRGPTIVSMWGRFGNGADELHAGRLGTAGGVQRIRRAPARRHVHWCPRSGGAVAAPTACPDGANHDESRCLCSDARSRARALLVESASWRFRELAESATRVGYVCGASLGCGATPRGAWSRARGSGPLPRGRRPDARRLCCHRVTSVVPASGSSCDPASGAYRFTARSRTRQPLRDHRGTPRPSS